MAHVVERPRALRDLDGIFDYIATDSEPRAVSFIRTVRERLALLAENPLAGRTRDELAPRLRSFPIGRYVVFYRPLEAGDGIEVVRGAARSAATPGYLPGGERHLMLRCRVSGVLSSRIGERRDLVAALLSALIFTSPDSQVSPSSVAVP